MWMAFIGAANGVFGWLKANPIVVKIVAIGTAILAAWTIKERWEANVEKGVRRQEREKAARERAEDTAIVINTIQENSDEIVRNSERVRARDVAVELPDGAGAALPAHHYRD